jgi:hypothetical protein
MSCSCGGTADPEGAWEAVHPDGTIEEPLSKREATEKVSKTGGYIRQKEEATA